MKVTYQNKEYQVGITRAAARSAESAGFNINEVYSKPTMMIPTLVYYGFWAYNKGIKRQLVEEIYDQLPQKEDFITALVEAYADTVGTLMDSSDQGNASWTMD